MRTFVVTPPAPIVVYEEAVARLRLAGGEDERADVEGMIAAATRTVDGPAGWLGRCLGPQVIETRFDNWDCGSLRLPYPPVIEVLSVSYVDGGGAVQTVAPAAYELLGDSLVPVFGTAWPTARWGREAVHVRYWAGYADTAVNANAIAGMKAAVLLMVNDLYRRLPITAPVEGMLPPRVYF